MKNILFLFALCSLALTSCEDFFSQTVEIDPPPYEKQICFHLFLSDRDSSVNMLLTRNYGILETVPNYEDYFLDGGSAELYKDGQKWLTLAPLNQDSTFVLTATLPEPFQAGSNYEIKCTHPDFPTVNAVQAMPADFVVDSVRLKRNSSTGQYGDQLDQVEVMLRDQPGVKNFYEVIISRPYYDVVYNETTGMLDTIAVHQSPIYAEDYLDPNVYFGVKAGGLISDQFFDGQSYKFQARIYSSGSTDPVTVQVRNVTEDYYKWSRSYQLKNDDDGNPLVEPVAVFNNLTGGIGIFSLCKEKVYLAK